MYGNGVPSGNMDMFVGDITAATGLRHSTVNVGTGKPTTFNRLIEILNEVLGTQLAPDYFDNPYSFYQNKTQAAARSFGKLPEEA